MISGRALADNPPRTRYPESMVRQLFTSPASWGRDILRAWSDSYSTPLPLGFPLWRERGEGDPPNPWWNRRDLRSVNGDYSLGLDFRVRTARTMSLIDDQGMMDVIREASLEGAPRSVIEAHALLSKSPYTLTKTLYILWDMAVAMREIRPLWKGMEVAGRVVIEGETE